MPLLLRKTRPSAEPAQVGRHDGPTSSSYTSQAFRLWNDDCDSGAKRHVLELGSANREGLTFFGTAPCRLEVVGLDRAVPLVVVTDDEDDDPGRWEAEALRACLPALPERSQHGALAWDLLNYLSHAQRTELGRWLAGVLALDAVVHVVLYTGAHMPACPSQFHILEADRLERRPAEGNAVDCPRISQGDLKRDWPDFEVVRSFLLRNESQEFVLRRL